MFYEWVYPLHEIPGLSALNVFRYITFRTAYAAITALLTCFVLGPPMIGWLSRVRFGQKVREDGPQSHLQKAGTPTMGGILIVTAIVIPTLLWGNFHSRPVWLALLATVWLGALGFLDDYLRVVKGLPKGLLGRYKLVGQIALGAVLGTSLGFLWYNAHPADVFMGDTGSLALGGALGTVAVLIKREFWLVLVGGVFVAEALSVMIQVASFKLWGKRVFRMSPLHHHFELGGWAESRVVLRFYIIGALLALFSLSTLKLQ